MHLFCAASVLSPECMPPCLPVQGTFWFPLVSLHCQLGRFSHQYLADAALFLASIFPAPDVASWIRVHIAEYGEEWSRGRCRSYYYSNKPGLNAPCMTLYTSLCVEDIMIRVSEAHAPSIQNVTLNTYKLYGTNTPLDIFIDWKTTLRRPLLLTVDKQLTEYPFLTLEQ